MVVDGTWSGHSRKKARRISPSDVVESRNHKSKIYFQQVRCWLVKITGLTANVVYPGDALDGNQTETNSPHKTRQTRKFFLRPQTNLRSTYHPNKNQETKKSFQTMVSFSYVTVLAMLATAQSSAMDTFTSGKLDEQTQVKKANLRTEQKVSTERQGRELMPLAERKLSSKRSLVVSNTHTTHHASHHTLEQPVHPKKTVKSHKTNHGTSHSPVIGPQSQSVTTDDSDSQARAQTQSRQRGVLRMEGPAS